MAQFGGISGGKYTSSTPAYDERRAKLLPILHTLPQEDVIDFYVDEMCSLGGRKIHKPNTKIATQLVKSAFSSGKIVVPQTETGRNRFDGKEFRAIKFIVRLMCVQIEIRKRIRKADVPGELIGLDEKYDMHTKEGVALSQLDYYFRDFNRQVRDNPDYKEYLNACVDILKEYDEKDK